MNIRKGLARGFTLIELLVVIAIIGLLASIILASLNSARGKGADAAIKGQLRNTQSQAEIIYDNASPNAYTTVCSDTTVQSQVTGAASAAGASTPSWLGTQVSSATQAVCHSQSASYAILVPLKTDSANGWCVDSTGAARSVVATGLGSGVYACP